MMKKFKFELGQKVNHASQRSGMTSDSMIILSRMFEESANGVDERYMVSIMNMGQPQRHLLHAAELKAID